MQKEGKRLKSYIILLNVSITIALSLYIIFLVWTDYAGDEFLEKVIATYGILMISSYISLRNLEYLDKKESVFFEEPTNNSATKGE